MGRAENEASWNCSHSLFICFKFFLLCLPNLNFSCKYNRAIRLTFVKLNRGIPLLVPASRGTGSVRIVSSLFEYRTFFDTTHSILSSTFSITMPQSYHRSRSYAPIFAIHVHTWYLKLSTGLNGPAELRWDLSMVVKRWRKNSWASYDTSIKLSHICYATNHTPVVSLCWTPHVHDQSEPWTCLGEFPFAPAIIDVNQLHLLTCW